MCNGLDITFNLGRHWCDFVVALAALIPVFCFGQFSSTDSANLANISYYISYLQSNHSELTDIYSQLTILDDIQDAADDAVTILNTISSTLSSLQPGVIGSKIESVQTAVVSVQTAVEDVGDELHEMRLEYKKSQRIETNLLNNAFSEIIDTLDLWGNGISNVLANIQPGVGVVYTNFPALLYGGIVDMDTEYASFVLEALTGQPYSAYSPAAFYFSSLYQEGVFLRYFQDLATRFGFPDDGGDYDRFYWDILNRLWIDLEPYSVASYGELNYYEYGTRPLITLFEQYYAQATNDFPVVGSTIEGSGTNSTFSSSFVGAVGGLAESFTHSTSIDDDISEVATNSIENIEDQGYHDKLAQITSANMADTTQIAGIADAVANIQNEYQSLIGINSIAEQFVLDFGTVGAFGFSKAVSFTLARPTSQMYWNVQDFFFAVLKAIGLLTTVYSIYVHIAAETEV